MRLVPLLLLTATPALAQTPNEDSGFDGATTPADPDLVIVRERAYGAAGVDLAPYGIPGVHDYVQSIYVRNYQGVPGQESVFRGRLVFPPGVTVLGVITDATNLGGSTDDAAWTATDALFGIGTDPDLYSAPGRGLDSYVEGDHAFVRSNNTVDLYLNARQDNLDDVRVIVDYGSSFPASVEFEVQLLVDSAAVNFPGDHGVRVGEVPSGTAGTGVWGSADGLAGIPLIGAGMPVATAGFALDPTGCILVHRNGSMGENGTLEWYDPQHELSVLHARSGPWRDLERGPAGRIYGLDLNFRGIVTLDLLAGSEGRTPLQNAPVGLNFPTALTHVPGTDTFFVAAQGSLNAALDLFSVELRTGDVLQDWQQPAGTMTQAVAGVAVVGNEAFVLGQTGSLLRLDMTTGVSTVIPLTGGRSYQDLRRDANGTGLYLLSKTLVTATLNVERYDAGTGVVSAGISDSPQVIHPRSLCLDDQGLLWIGTDSLQTQGPGKLLVVDPATWSTVADHPAALHKGSQEILFAPVPDRFDVPYCVSPVRTSDNTFPWIAAFGSPTVGTGDLELRSFALPAQEFGYFLNAPASGLIPMPGTAYNNLCLDPSIGRFNAQIGNSGSHRTFGIQVDLANFPRPTNTVQVLPGQTWYFQCWFRDNTASGFTDAIAITFN